MKVKRLILGNLDTNCYIIEKGNNVLIIDPASEYPKIEEAVGGKTISGVLLTHNHYDHIGAVDEVVGNNSIPVFDICNTKEGSVKIDNFNFEAIYTLGHTSTCVSYYFKEENCLFSGDFLFKGSIGRCDLPTGSESDMKKSLEKIKKYPKDMIIYPGHGDSTTLGDEIKNNPYL